MTAPDTVGERLARIETKLDAWLNQQSSHETRVQADHIDHESRIRRLERALWLATGFAAAFGGAAGSVITKLLGS